MMDEDASAMIIQMSYNVVEGENEVLGNVRVTNFTFTFIATVAQACCNCRYESQVHETPALLNNKMTA